MIIGDFKVSRKYRLVQFIFDVFSAGMIYLTVANFIILIYSVNDLNTNYLSNEANISGKSLSWYPIILWLALALIVIITSFVFIYKSKPMPKKYKITEKTSQKYYNMLVFAASAIRFIALWEIFELSFIHGQRILGSKMSYISLLSVCNIILILIVIVFTKHIINGIVSLKEKNDISFTEH